MNYLVDTNIIKALLRNDEKIKRKLEQIVFCGKEIFINAISYYETKRGLLDINAIKQLIIFNEVCKKFRILLLDNQGIFDKASEIYVDLKHRKPSQLIKDADILIAAMSLTGNLILVSDDTDFLRIKDINLENWLK